eukprot:Opistho-1_new@28470
MRPQGLAATGVGAAVKARLRAIINDRDPGPRQDVRETVEECRGVAINVEKPRVVVVVEEQPEDADVLEELRLGVQLLLNLRHGAALLERMAQAPVHRVIECRVQRALVPRVVRGIAVVHLPHREDARRPRILGPKCRVYLRDRVDSDAVDAILNHGRVDPREQRRRHKRVVLVQIREAAEPAELDLRLVRPVGDLAHRVVVCRIVERREGREVADLAALVTHVVGDDVQHHIHAAGVAGSNEVLEVLGCSKATIHAVYVARKVAVVPARRLLRNRADPDGIEPHARNVVKPVLNPFESAPAIILEVGACRRRVLCLCEPVGEQLT